MEMVDHLNLLVEKVLNCCSRPVCSRAAFCQHMDKLKVIERKRLLVLQLMYSFCYEL
jgi:hypothetical protein